MTDDKIIHPGQFQQPVRLGAHEAKAIEDTQQAFHPLDHDEDGHKGGSKPKAKRAVSRKKK